MLYTLTLGFMEMPTLGKTALRYPGDKEMIIKIDEYTTPVVES